MGNCIGRCCSCCRCGTFRKVWRPGNDKLELGVLPRPPSIIVTDIVDFANTEVLTIKDIDLCIKENGEYHHTSKYELVSRESGACLVIRRGQQFNVKITTTRPYNSEKDAISFIFTVSDAEKPNYGQNTLVAIPLLTKDLEIPNSWNAIYDRQDGNDLFVAVTTSPDCIVGKWKVDVDSRLQSGAAISYSHPLPIYVLFNPWCRQDDVFMAGDERREEYVLADTGLIWRGSYNRLRPSVWKYAQFEKDILECALFVVHEIGKVKGTARGDPIRVSRAISAAVNSPDDNGVVMGNWSDDHGGGTPPTQWVGSMKILQKFFEKKKPVKYGQCWVFSGVLATVCRAIGIPCRVVTTYSAAHDTQGSLTVDYFVDEKGNVMEELNSDSIWNYHVWNEVWMERHDLGVGYSGWQAVDATPQELSDDVYRCGPASVLAVKQGEIQRPYDNGFLFAEVNADKVFWKYAGPTQPLKLIRKDADSIGQAISTKAVGKWEREDITMEYKYPEKSSEERATMLKALKMSESLFSRYYLNENFNDIYFDFELRDDIKIGQHFSVVLLVKNRSSDKEYTIEGSLRVDTVMYTGKVSEPVKVQRINSTVKPEAKEEIRMLVSFDEYYKRLVDQCSFNIACLVSVVDTGFEYFAQDDFRVRKPDIKITMNTPTPTTGVDFVATIKLENPLPIPLKKGKFMIEGVGLEKQMIIDLNETIAPGTYATAQMTLTPPWSGRHTIAAKFTSKEMDDVDGFLAFMVQPKAEINGSHDVEKNEV